MKQAVRVLAVAALALAAVPVGRAQQPQTPAGTLEVIRLRPNFYLIAGAGANIAVNIGSDGVIVVDCGSAAMADAALAEIRKLTPLRIRYIINTAEDDDHVGGNEKFARAGESLFIPGNLGPGGGGNFTGITNEGAASIIGTENMSLRMSGSSGAPSRYATVAQPSETFARKQKLMYLNDESIQIIHTAPAHTDGDAIVLFRQSDVIVTGDVFDMTRFPFIDLARGGSVQGEIDVLNQLIDLTVPSIPLPWKEGGTTVVPGHGRLSQQAELVEYRDMVAIIADRVKAMIKDGMTLDQVKKAKPTSGWDRRFGATSGLSRAESRGLSQAESREPWTTDMFVEAVYKSLSPTPKPKV